MKRTRIVLAVALILAVLCLSGCSNPKEQQEQMQTQTQGQTERSETEVTLYADFSMGSEATEELVKTTTDAVSEVTAQTLADSLSRWIGLDFTLDGASVSGNRITVDWSAESTLIAGLDDREQKEEFFVYDVYSLRWMMMDSLYRTLIENLEVKEVCYTMDGGQELRFDDLYPVNIFPADEPYMGSAYYFAQAEGQEEAEGAVAPAVLMSTASFTGTTPLTTDNDYMGGYYYSEQTADGLTVIVNCCIGVLPDDPDEFDSYIRWFAGRVSDAEPVGFTAEESAEYTERMSYPVHLLSWLTGEGEDARQWDAFFFMTDSHAYLYAFGTTPDNAAEMQETWQSVFEGLFLAE